MIICQIDMTLSPHSPTSPTQASITPSSASLPPSSIPSTPTPLSYTQSPIPTSPLSYTPTSPLYTPTHSQTSPILTSQQINSRLSFQQRNVTIQNFKLIRTAIFAIHMHW